jgi:hypothetical protein
MTSLAVKTDVIPVLFKVLVLFMPKLRAVSGTANPANI